jgi:dipeptidyl aminopeptidase/acylaminoacyl peptidase
MDEPRTVIERSLSRVESESYTLESFYRRRDRARTRQRFTAGIVGLTIAIVIGLVGSVILRSATEDLPLGRKGPQILRNGEVLQVEDQFGDTATLVATDLETGTQRLLHRCVVPSGDHNCGYIQQFALSAQGGWIAWEQACTGGGTEPCTSGLWLVGADGPPVHVTTSGDTDSPDRIWAWSPAAERLAFATQRSGPAELVLLDPATDERTSIPTVTGISSLSWSPDGTTIAVASPSSGAYVVDLSTGGSTEISQVGAVEEVSWSPDGTRIVLDESSGGRDRIIVVNAEGSGHHVLVDQDVSQDLGGPAWSPDGTRIAYVRTPPREPGSIRNVSSEVWVIGADGIDATRLFHGEWCCIDGPWGIVWSPEGDRIAFNDHDEMFGRFVVNADGTGSPERVDEVVVDGWIQP